MTNIMSVFPFLVIFRMLSGLPGSIWEKSIGAEGLLCSGRSPSSMSSSFYEDTNTASRVMRNVLVKRGRREGRCVPAGAVTHVSTGKGDPGAVLLYLAFR